MEHCPEVHQTPKNESTTKYSMMLSDKTSLKFCVKDTSVSMFLMTSFPFDVSYSLVCPLADQPSAKRVTEAIPIG